MKLLQSSFLSLKKSYLYSRNFEYKTSSTESLSFQKGPGTLVQGHKLKKKKKMKNSIFRNFNSLITQPLKRVLGYKF